MSELLRRGFIAALAPIGVPNADIVVTDLEGSRLCSVQVKTRRELGSDGGWHMGEKHERIRGERLFYAFVDFGKALDEHPVVYVVPSSVVADVIRDSHQVWLSTPGKKGQQRKDGPFRRFLPDYTRVYGPGHRQYGPGWLEQYRNAWHLLALDATPPISS
ncbi:hypothetical protein [Chthonobacter albigriseus]|uniref:hypothetical protein n=1 Tax=Chthonobacter albigriseus TaxID=1683161 RepID=UPI0015EFC5B0|nr:hypothetical protein [Chthonobacter albigriseus]